MNRPLLLIGVPVALATVGIVVVVSVLLSRRDRASPRPDVATDRGGQPVGQATDRIGGPVGPSRSHGQKSYRLDPSTGFAGRDLTRLTEGKIHRFVEGIDPSPRDLSDEEAASLNDLWATTVLRKGIFPKDIVEILM